MKQRSKESLGNKLKRVIDKDREMPKSCKIMDQDAIKTVDYLRETIQKVLEEISKDFVFAEEELLDVVPVMVYEQNGRKYLDFVRRPVEFSVIIKH